VKWLPFHSFNINLTIKTFTSINLNNIDGMTPKSVVI